MRGLHTLFLIPLLLSPLHAAESRSWRAETLAHGATPQFGAFPLLLHSATYDAGVLTLRAGLRNALAQPAAAPLPLDAASFSLRNEATGESRPCVGMEDTWRAPMARPLEPQESVVAQLRFQVDHTWLDKRLTLVSGTHAPLPVVLEDANQFTPPDLKPMEGRTVMIDETQAPLGGGNRDVTMRLGQMRWAEGRITVEVVFTNIARYAFVMERCPRGADARLLDADGHALAQFDVRGGIIDRMAPEGRWAPGAEVRGMISFATPHPHAAHRLWFCFPGYPQLPLMLDTAKGELRVDSAHRQTPVVTQARILSTIEQKTFDSVAAFWSSLSKEVEAARFDSALKLFDMERAPELFNGIENIAFESFQITPYPGQSLTLENGELRIVSLELRHRLKGQRGTNAFWTPMYCRMATQQDGTWRVKALTFPRTPTFWCRGFTQIMRSARFHVVHKDTEDDRQQARSTAQTLEAAYDSLLAAGLPMSATYVAFHCSSEGDFQILSGADPAFASGAAPGHPIIEDGRLNVYNLAIYANDTTYRKSHTFGDPKKDQMLMLRHELVHLALGDWTRPWSPGWLVEGMAVYFSGERMNERPDILADAIRGGLSLRTLSGDSHLRPDNGDALGLYLKYQLSARVVEWIARHHGETSLQALYTAFGTEFPALWQREFAGEHTPETSQAKQAARVEMTELFLKKHLGTSISQIEAAVAQEIMKAARR